MKGAMHSLEKFLIDDWLKWFPADKQQFVNKSRLWERCATSWV